MARTPREQHLAEVAQWAGTRKVVTEYWAKPIPFRDCDWQATFEDYEYGDPIGLGRTEEEAIEDLMMLVAGG